SPAATAQTRSRNSDVGSGTQSAWWYIESSSRKLASSAAASDRAKVDLPDPEVPTTETRRTAAEPSNGPACLSPSFRPGHDGQMIESRGDGMEIHAPRGSQRSCKGWAQEAAMRMLMNNLDPEVAEHPDQLIVYGGSGRAARSWDAYAAIIATLQDLNDDETLLVQSGKPVGVLTTHEWAPRVLIANSNLVPQWATWEEFRRLEQLGLTMYGQMTAGSWIYIGTQGILQGTYETLAAVAAKRFGGTLAGTITLTGGLGGMGGAQPLAVTMNDGVAICVDVDPSRIARRIEHGYLDVQADSIDDALARAYAAAAAGQALSIGLLGNAAEIVPALLAMNGPINLVTDQ